MATARFIRLDSAGNKLRSNSLDLGVAVLDRETKLIWMRETLPCGEVNWKRAQQEAAAVKACGATDWRLPTRKELLTLVDDTRHSPAIDTDFFVCQSSWYWTSTPAAFSPGDHAWFVYFSNGYSYWSYQSRDYYVRAVRSSQSFGKLA